MQENIQKKSLIKRNILQYLAKIGVTPYEFYKKSGVTRGVLQQSNGISEDNIARFLAYAPGVNTEWLLTGEGEMLKPNVPQGSNHYSFIAHSSLDSSDKDTDNSLITQEVGQGIPYFDVDFVGGFNEIFNCQDAIPACNIIVPGFEKAQVWCNVTGNSMEPKINHGDIIALRECSVADVQYGEIYAVVLDTIRTIKIIRRGSEPNLLRFVPINVANFDEQEFPVTRIIKIFEVLGSVKKFF